MIRKGKAIWTGSIRDGRGMLSTDSGVLADTAYGFQSRFENGKGTNPEELIGAAHAGCFSMALSKVLGDAGLTPERIATTAEISLDKAADGFQISASHLRVVAKVPGTDEGRFVELAEQAKVGCPVSKLLNAKITMEARLES